MPLSHVHVIHSNPPQMTDFGFLGCYSVVYPSERSTPSSSPPSLVPMHWALSPLLGHAHPCETSCQKVPHNLALPSPLLSFVQSPMELTSKHPKFQPSLFMMLSKVSYITVPCLSISTKMTRQTKDLTSQYNSEDSPLLKVPFLLLKVL